MNKGKFRTWWWKLWNPQKRIVYRATDIFKDCLESNYVLMQETQVRKPFGEWTTVEGSTEGFQSATLSAEEWTIIRNGGYIVVG